jgi:proline iminopeptidase
MMATVNGVEIYFDIEGLGLVPDGPRMVERPVLVILHGGVLDHSLFKTWLSPLTDTFQLIYVDQRGCGRSGEADPSSYRLPISAEDVEALREYLGIERWCVFGSSYGGFLGLTYCLKYPESATLFIGSGTSPSHRSHARAAEILAEIGTPEQKAIGSHLFDGTITTEEDYREWWRVMFPLYYVDYDAQQAETALARTVINVDTALEMFRNDVTAYDIVDRLPDLACPALLLVGDSDWIIQPEQSELMARQIRDAELVIFERTGHFPYVERNEEFLAAIRDFARRKLAPAATEPS